MGTRGGMTTRYPEKPRLGPIPGLAELMTSMTGQFQAAGELQSARSPCFSELCVHKAKGARG